MAPLDEDALLGLLNRYADTSLATAVRAQAAREIARRFPYASSAEALADMAADPLTPERTVSHILQVLHVGARKNPELEVSDAFHRVASSTRRTMALRTDAFMRLLVLDPEAARRCAERHLPAMLPLVHDEAARPAIRTPDEPYEEALLPFLRR